MTNNDGLVIGITPAHATASAYLLEPEWDWLRSQFGERIPVLESRRLSRRPRTVIPGPCTCKYCKHMDGSCTRGRHVEDPTKTVCNEWSEA